MLVGGDLGGPVVQDLALRLPDWVDRMVLFNSPLPYDKERMAGLRTRPAAEAADYFIRQGTDADALAAELATPEQRRRYIATFYTSRFWAHPGAFARSGRLPHRAVRRRRQAAGQLRRLRERLRRGGAQRAADAGAQRLTPTLILFGPCDHVLYPDFDRMAAVVFDDHVGPFLLRDCGHFVPWEAPHALVSGVRMMAADLLAARRSGPLSRS